MDYDLVNYLLKLLARRRTIKLKSVCLFIANSCKLLVNKFINDSVQQTETDSNVFKYLLKTVGHF